MEQGWDVSRNTHVLDLVTSRQVTRSEVCLGQAVVVLELVDVLHVTILILESEADLTSTIPGVVHIRHLDLSDVKNKSRLTRTITLINVPVTLRCLGVDCLSQNDVRGSDTLVLRLNNHLVIVHDTNNLVGLTTDNDVLILCKLRQE